ncbi:MAG: phosphopyruvate hydratase [Candidatus Methanoperedens sp.]
MNKIIDMKAREVLDSRAHPTIEVEVSLDNGIVGRFSVPSGASTGAYEAHELRDGDEKRFFGKGVTKAIAKFNEIVKPALLGKDASNQEDIDNLCIELDGTSNKSKIGANTILATSVACAKASADSLRIPLYEYFGGSDARVLPVPMMNIINGGRHADNNLDIQEFMIMPVGASKFSDAVRMAAETYHCLKSIIKSKGYSTGVGDEGGFAPDLKSNEEAIKLIVEAISKTGYEPGRDICIALDVAASELYKDGKYVFHGEKDLKTKSSEDLVNYYRNLTEKYPIVSIEDGMAEDDWSGWKLLTEELGRNIQLVGDDIFVTNIHRLQEGIAKGIANSIIIKPNQIGTLTEMVAVIKEAKKAEYRCVISNRSAETGEKLLANLAVGYNTGLIKAGSVCRGERTANYNELIRIEERLGSSAIYKGIDTLSNKGLNFK